MRPLILTLALLPTAALAGTGQFPIINGQPATPDDFPSALQILIEGAVPDLGMPLTVAPECTGTLIAPDVVLTAGHCKEDTALGMGFFTVQDLGFYVTWQADNSAVGTNPGTALPDDAVRVSGWVAHPQWDMANFDGFEGGLAQMYDIALMFLEDEVHDVAPAWLPTAEEGEGLVEGLEVSIVGYGQQTVTSSPFEPPPEGTVAIRIQGESFINEVGDFELQIGDGPDSTRKCHGDSGGPTYADIGLGTPDLQRVVGITSHAYDQTDCNKGGIDTRVDPYLSWIDQAMREACDDGLRTACDPPGILVQAATGDDDDASADDDGGSGGRGCQDCAASTSGRGAPLAWLLLAVPAILRRRR